MHYNLLTAFSISLVKLGVKVQVYYNAIHGLKFQNQELQLVA